MSVLEALCVCCVQKKNEPRQYVLPTNSEPNQKIFAELIRIRQIHLYICTHQNFLIANKKASYCSYPVTLSTRTGRPEQTVEKQVEPCLLLIITPNKVFFHSKSIDFFSYFSTKTLCCGYSLELPQ